MMEPSKLNQIINTVDHEFHRLHPELKGRNLGLGPEDAKFREEWNRLLVKQVTDDKRELARVLGLATHFIGRA